MHPAFRSVTLFLGLAIAILSVSPSMAEPKEKVRVLGYHFPPYFDETDLSGISRDFITLLNRSQQELEFIHILTTSKRRYRDLDQGRGDVILFEMPEWGWNESGVSYQSTEPILTGGEVYLALAEPGKNQAYFESLKGKRIAAILGFHYGFAGYNADQGWLQQNFNILLGNSPEKNITLLENKRADIAIVSLAYLRRLQKDNPGRFGRLLVSDQLDQDYHLSALIRPDSTVIDRERFSKILQSLKQSGQLHAFFRDLNLADRLIY